MTRSSVPPPVTAVMDAASAWLPARMAVVEDRLTELAGAYGPKLGDNGNNGPGPELTQIGARLPRSAIARSLEVGPGIMPSYSSLPPQKLQALTAYLASLN